MHLLAATPGSVDDGKEPVDLGQTPAEVIFISAADTELAALSTARSEMSDPPSLRLANMMHLQHPMSVDLHIESCASKAKLVVVRVLGGASYWKYGFEQYAARLIDAGVAFAALPGDDKPDRELRQFSTIPDEDYDSLWAYLVEGGPKNSVNFLNYCNSIINQADPPQAAESLLRAGVYWPGAGISDISSVQEEWKENAPVVPLVFYRALVQGAGLNPINRMVRALLREEINPLPIFVASLKDPISVATLDQLFQSTDPDTILNCTSFAVGNPHGDGNPDNPLTLPSACKAPVLQVVLSASTEQDWEKGLNGLSARDIAMNVALPEVDGRILSRAVSFKGEAFFDEATQCPIATYKARGDRISFVAALASNWTNLRRTNASERQVALVLANYPNKDGRLANGVGLDTPESAISILKCLQKNGYNVLDLPKDSTDLMAHIMAGPTNWLTNRVDRSGGKTLSLTDYLKHYKELPYSLRKRIEDRWGTPSLDPFFEPTTEAKGGNFKLSIMQFGNVTLGLQPARGYNIDPTETYHSPDLVPPHNYLAFYFWLRHSQGAHAIVHLGKHGNLEWLPGKAVALSEECLPEAILGPTPHLYPFIVNDPGEGTQAKRRSHAVIIDHLTPPMSRAETYGPLRDLEALVDEYYEAAGIDPRRIDYLRREILTLSATTGLDKDIGFQGEESGDLAKLDAYLCDLKEAQIRDGLHVFGQTPEGSQLRDLTIALARIPRSSGKAGNASLLRAMADDFGMGFDPLDCNLAELWQDHKPEALVAVSDDIWRSNGDTVERLELLAQSMVETDIQPPGPKSSMVIDHIRDQIAPTLARCGPYEIKGLLSALAGKFVNSGPSGAPTRGRLDVLPTGRNFYSVDSRAVPTPTAWALGWKSANLLIDKHLQDHGDWPRALLLTAWGTANMRTGGDDIAQCLALMGVKPKWDTANRRVTGFEIIPSSTLGRPRVDVTLRISGFFRDAFPGLIDLVDSAARAVLALDEPNEINPAKENGPGARVYGSKPGAYGAGLQALIDERIWDTQADFGTAYLEWGSYAYGEGRAGNQDRTGFEARLGQVEAIVQNQDNREHDLLDSDDYYQFQGGAAAAITSLQGQARPIYHNDHSRPERPIIRTLDDEIARVIRSRVLNPKWINGVKRHGYKGAFEIAATVDYMFAFAATTGAVKSHHFDAVESTFLEDDDNRNFIAKANAPALREIAQRLQESIDRGLWHPRSNSARARVADLLPKD